MLSGLYTVARGGEKQGTGRAALCVPTATLSNPTFILAALNDATLGDAALPSCRTSP